MKGLNGTELAAIDVELKEAVCDGIVGSLVARISASDERGRVVFGRSPRRGILAGQLLPRFDVAGSDETTDIRIAAIGMDLLVGHGSGAKLKAVPRFSAYVRVLPDWTDLKGGGGELDFDFKIQQAVQQQIDADIRARRQPPLDQAGLARPDWRSLDEGKRAQVRAERARIISEVRKSAYATFGIQLEDQDEEPAGDEPVDVAEANDAASDPNKPDDETPAPPPISRLIREGRSVPTALIDPAALPGKWVRLDITPPPLEFDANASDQALEAAVTAHRIAVRDETTRVFEEWLAGPGAATAWRDVRVRPEQTLTRDAWEILLASVATQPIDRPRLLPHLDGICVRVERQRDFLDPERVSIRVTLDNRGNDTTPQEAAVRCNAVFAAALALELPKSVHRPLRLDRVEPSYRFRDFLDYPAIGLNCGVEASDDGDVLRLSTTVAPRFAQPRVAPRHIDMPTEFAVLKDPAFDPRLLLALPDAYDAWIGEEETNLAPVVVAGLDIADAVIETARLKKDVAAQRAESRYIRRGVDLLIVSKAAFIDWEGGQRSDGALARRSAPWRAWTMTNEAFARRDRHLESRGWRLFQMAFVLAHTTVFASRMDDFRDFTDPTLDEDGASLLYFPTGGGKSEAFYGALLFAMFFDRLRGKDRGVTALIRYPLRLLTLQQAQRLLKLVVHAEIVRRHHKAGAWPFEMGFWVGGTNTPNRYSEFRADAPMIDDPAFPDDDKLDGETGDDALKQRGRRYTDVRDAYDKVPSCPMCGEATGLRRDERDGPRGKRMAIVCFSKKCEWNKEHGATQPLPFLLTDDAVYGRAPAIVLGTVDKLAMLGQSTGTIPRVLGMFGTARWVDAAGNLDTPRREEELRDGPGHHGCEPVAPAYAEGRRVFHDPFPSLVIQDEAHLLEESLGTFSGLFDTLLETMLGEIYDLGGETLGCARRWTGDGLDGPRMPKIVAATATISAPERQLQTLYQRRPLRFPYPGSDIYRSFFAEPAPAPKINSDRVALAAALPPHRAPEATAPWMRLYVSLMTNDATHTVTAVGVLAAFHAIITELWDGLLSQEKRAEAIASIRAGIAPGQSGDWRRAALDRASAEGRAEEVLALVDLHRIALAYVTNKKGGDQIMDALGSAIDQAHRRTGRAGMRFDSRLISGGVDMKDIQAVMADAERSFAGKDVPDIATTVRSIVATSAISHGVDVDRFNSMFFAGLPSDIAEYIQASSRVGRAHVGFVMLLPTPQNRRDRYVVETHDTFHRFLERMIAPPAVERWAENAVKRALASYVQAWAMLEETRAFQALPSDRKAQVTPMDDVSRLATMAQRRHVAFAQAVGEFALTASGFNGRGPAKLGAPHYEEHYRRTVDHAIDGLVRDLASRAGTGRLQDYWADRPALKPPMTSLRDVDEAGWIVAAASDPLATTRTRSVDVAQLAEVMRAIRSQRGSGELDADGGVNG